MATQVFWEGQGIAILVNFTDPDASNAGIDMDTVTCTVKWPDGTTTTPTMSTTGTTGEYKGSIDSGTSDGDYYARIVGVLSGRQDAVDEVQFQVRGSNVI